MHKGKPTPTATFIKTRHEQRTVVQHPDFDLMAQVVFARARPPVRLDGCGHFVPWEMPHRFCDEVIAFLRR